MITKVVIDEKGEENVCTTKTFKRSIWFLDMVFISVIIYLNTFCIYVYKRDIEALVVGANDI